MRDNGWSRLSLVLFISGLAVLAFSVIPGTPAQTSLPCYPGPYPVPPGFSGPCPCYPGPGPAPPGFQICSCYPGPAPVPPGFSGQCPCYPGPGPAPPGFRSCVCYPGPPPAPPGFTGSCPCYPYPGPPPAGFRACACYPGPAPVPPGFSFPCPCYPGPAPVPPGFQDCTAQQIASLPHLIGVFHLPPGVGNSLLVKAQAVQSSFGSGNKTAACNQLNALINEAQAQTGKQLTAQQSKQLIAAAQLARKMLGCK